MIDNLIICMECENKSNSDFIYINEILNHFYHDITKSGELSIKYVLMRGKHNYNNQFVIDDISKYTKDKFKIVYILDKDDSSISPTDQQFIQDVERYTELNNYGLVWFVREIECLMLGKSSNNKSKDAATFRRKKSIKDLNEQTFRNPNPQNRFSSNFLIVFDEIFSR